MDEAAPPALMRDLALEILRRNLQITWWTNIRFEKSFTSDLCRLLAASGCVAVTGGLEVASDRLLELMKKGVTVHQVANVASHFTKANILVHAYLMYGFPTQNEQETIDSLEIVRQMMEEGVIQSGFWHQFAMTAHSPVGIDPAAFHVVKTGPDFHGFAENDCYHEDPSGADHDKFSDGLSISLHNYMNGAGFDLPLQEWFDFKIPKTKIPKNHIRGCINNIFELPKNHQLVIWLASHLSMTVTSLENEVEVTVFNMNREFVFKGPLKLMQFLKDYLPKLCPYEEDFNLTNVSEFKTNLEAISSDMLFDEFINSYLFYNLRKSGLVFV